MKTKDCSEIELVRRAMKDMNAFGELVEHYRDSITRQCFSYVHDREYAEDLAQETFVRAWLKLEQLREPLVFSSWLRKIASNVCNEFTRGSARQECPWEIVPEEAVLDRNNLDTTDLLDNLPKQSRLCLDLHYQKGLSYSEIASILGSSPVSVRNRLHRAKEALRKEMADMAPLDRSPFTQRVIDKLEQLESNIPEHREQAAVDLKKSLEEDKHQQILDYLRGKAEQEEHAYEAFNYVAVGIKESKKLQTPEIRDALVEIILHSEFEELRLKAAGAIIAQRDPTAIQFLEKALEDPKNPKEVIAALKSSITQLKKMDMPVHDYESIRLRRDVEQAANDRKARFELMKKLIAALDDPSPKVQNNTLKALGELGDKRAAPAIKKLLNYTSVKTRQAALIVLGKLKSKKATPAIIRLLETENDPMTLQAAVKSLAEIRDSSAVQAVIDMLHRTDAKGPALLFISMGYFVEFATNEDIPAINDIISSFSAKIGHMSEGVTRHLHWIYANHGDERYLPELIEAAKADSYDTALVNGVARIMGDKALDVMKMLLLSHANETAAYHLIKIGKHGFDVIQEAMNSENWLVRQKVCRSLFFGRGGVIADKSGNQEVVDILNQVAAHDPISSVRFYAKAALLRVHRARRNEQKH